MLCCHSDPLQEPGGHRLPAGGSCDALPGSHQAAGARLCQGGGRQGKVVHQRGEQGGSSMAPTVKG